MRLTLADAQLMDDKAAARGPWLIWIVTTADMEYPGKVTARAHVVGYQGRTCLPGALVADTLDAPRATLPAELTRRDRMSSLPPNVIES